MSERLNTFPNPISTEEIQLAVKESEKFSIMGLIQSHGFQDFNTKTIDGIRIELNDGWALVRASNTTPCLTLRFEAKDQPSLDAIQTLVMSELKRIIPNLLDE